jgi:endonuclease I
VFCRISGNHSSGYEAFYFLGYNAVKSAEKSTDISEEHVAPNFTVKAQAKQDVSMKQVLLPASYWFLTWRILQL